MSDVRYRKSGVRIQNSGVRRPSAVCNRKKLKLQRKIRRSSTEENPLVFDWDVMEGEVRISQNKEYGIWRRRRPFGKYRIQE